MKKIDKSTYIKEHKMYSRFDKELCVSMEQLSTGCKTLINVYSFNDKIFDVIECGDNVIDEIFRLKQGNILISAFYLIPEFQGTVKVYTNNGVMMMNNEQLSNYVYEYYKDR